jgi:hypothetical protein
LNQHDSVFPTEKQLPDLITGTSVEGGRFTLSQLDDLHAAYRTGRRTDAEFHALIREVETYVHERLKPVIAPKDLDRAVTDAIGYVTQRVHGFTRHPGIPLPFARWIEAVVRYRLCSGRYDHRDKAREAV